MSGRIRGLRFFYLCCIGLVSACTQESGFTPVTISNLDPLAEEHLRKYEQRVANKSIDPVAWGELGIVYDLLQFREPANKCYLKAIELDPAEPRWHYFRAHMLAAQGNYEYAVAELFEVSALIENYPSLYLYGGDWLLNSGKFETARRWYQRASFAEWQLPSELGIARTHLKQNDPERALAVLAPLARKFDLPYINKLMADTYLLLNNLDEAEAYLYKSGTNFHSLNWRDPWLEERKAFAIPSMAARIAKIETAVQSGEYRASVGQLKQLWQGTFRNKRVLRAYITALKGIKEHDEAARLVDEGLSEFPDYYYLYIQKAEILRRNGDANAAVSHAKKAIEIDPSAPDGYAILARIYMDAANWLEAKDSIDYALRIDGSRPRWLIEGGIVEAKLGNWSSSAERLSVALENDATSGPAHLHYSRALIGLGEYTKADLHVKLARSYGTPVKQTQVIEAMIAAHRD